MIDLFVLHAQGVGVARVDEGRALHFWAKAAKRGHEGV